MREAFRRTRKDGATGIDGVTAADYEKDLEANLDGLLSRMKSGRYFAPPVRRHYIPKADGKKRPLGIPTFEDKVAQRAILMVLEPIYETDFVPCSYGFRPGRSAHDALNAVRKGIIEQRQRWVIDADLKAYFPVPRQRQARRAAQSASGSAGPRPGSPRRFRIRRPVTGRGSRGAVGSRPHKVQARSTSVVTASPAPVGGTGRRPPTPAR